LAGLILDRALAKAVLVPLLIALLGDLAKRMEPRVS
jgi:hypothetical protein